MTIKTVASYWCMFICVLIIIVSLATIYWHEFKLADPNVKDAVSHFNVGLWEKCEEVEYKKENRTEDKGCSDYEPPDYVDDWGSKRNTVVVMYVFALLDTLIAFIFITTYCATGKYYFPVKRSAAMFFIAALVMCIGLIVYTATFANSVVSFSWSYGAGWSAVAMYIITIVLLFADK